MRHKLFTISAFLFFVLLNNGLILAEDKDLLNHFENNISSTTFTNPQNPALNLSSASPSDYKVGPENVLQIDVYYGKAERISQKVRVSSQGVITFPLIGEVTAGGLTVVGLQDKLTKLLEKDYLVNPQVTVFIEEYSTVSIIGEVRRPGIYPIKGQLTVVELISLAEGFTKIAAQNKVKVIHTQPDGSKEEKIVKVYDFVNKNNGEVGNVVLHSGDVVIVPESFF